MILFETISEPQTVELKELNRDHDRSVFSFTAIGVASMPFSIGLAMTMESIGVESNWYLLATLVPLGAMAFFQLRGKSIERRLMEIERLYPDAVL